MYYDNPGTYSFLCTELGGNPVTAKEFNKKNVDIGDNRRARNAKDCGASNIEVTPQHTTSSPNSGGIVCDSILDMILFSGAMVTKVVVDVLGTYMVCGLGITLVSIPTPATEAIGIIFILDSITMGGVSSVGDISTLVYGISTYVNNGEIYIDYEVPNNPTEFVEWFFRGGLTIY